MRSCLKIEMGTEEMHSKFEPVMQLQVLRADVSFISIH